MSQRSDPCRYGCTSMVEFDQWIVSWKGKIPVYISMESLRTHGRGNHDRSRSESKTISKVFFIVAHAIFPAVDYYNPFSCGHHVLSPCEVKFKFDPFKLSNFPEAQASVSDQERQTILHEYNIVPTLSKDKMDTCTQTCLQSNMTCIEEGFAIVNDCKMMRSVFGKCECQSNAFGFHPHDPSIVNNWYCSLQETPIAKCDASLTLSYQGKRLCPCKGPSGNDR
jgi:hypothetical protein